MNSLDVFSVTGMGWVATHLIAFILGYAYGGWVAGWIQRIFDGHKERSRKLEDYDRAMRSIQIRDTMIEVRDRQIAKLQQHIRENCDEH